uniref:Uncharacterized protein n=1 Tax=Aegilops tauschii subsp. strangulata TaxID=200361 RepID=A0A453ET56_AEGTS
MFFGEGMLNTILIFLHHYIAPSLIFVCYKSNQKRMRKWKLKSRKTRNFTILIRMILSTATYQRTHTCKTEENCRFCNATKFKYESKGLCCKKGQIRLANPDTPPELMRLWTSNNSEARHFRNNIRFFNGHFSFTT